MSVSLAERFQTCCAMWTVYLAISAVCVRGATCVCVELHVFAWHALTCVWVASRDRVTLEVLMAGVLLQR